MYARIQTWFPFNIQVGLNGREWLTRQMNQHGLKYRQQGNCFVWIEDYEEAQKLMHRTVADPLGRVTERFRRAAESAARKPFRGLSGQLLLDV